LRDTKGDFIRGGLIAGAIGGAVLALVMILPVLGNAQYLWPGLQVASYPFIGPQVFHRGFHGGAMALGTFIHFALSMGFGVLFTFLVRRMTKVQAVALSIPFGAVIWVFMTYVALPLVGAGELAHRFPTGINLIQHIVFGLSIGLTLALLQPQNFRFGRTRKVIAT
jgi:hypothetical protein